MVNEEEKQETTVDVLKEVRTTLNTALWAGVILLLSYSGASIISAHNKVKQKTIENEFYTAYDSALFKYGDKDDDYQISSQENVDLFYDIVRRNRGKVLNYNNYNALTEEGKEVSRQTLTQWVKDYRPSQLSQLERD